MKRYLTDRISADLSRKMVLLTGPRQVGKTTLCRQLMARFEPGQYLNWDVPADRAVLLRQSWSPLSRLLVLDEVHKMPSWKSADRWRRQYFTDLIREDVLEYSRLHEVNAMRVFAELLRERVGSPLSLASLARDLAVSPNTLTRYLDILEALYIVFTVRPWHGNVARAILQSPKVYFYDTGLVKGDAAVRLENAVATMLLKHVQFQQDVHGRSADLHYIRTKDGAEVDFALSDDAELTHLIECKTSDASVHRALASFAQRFPQAQAIQLVRELRQEEWRAPVRVTDAAQWLAGLAA